MFKKALLGSAAAIAAAIAVILVIASTKPTRFQIERKIIIAAPASAIFPNLDDFHRWAEWSPWDKLDPNMKKIYGGPDHGPGATYAWSGDSKVGAGKMTITDARPPQQLRVRLEFLKPMAATNIAYFTLLPVPNHGGTQVTWAMEGENSFGAKVFSVFADMDKLVGKDFETGLANLKRVSEQAAGG